MSHAAWSPTTSLPRDELRSARRWLLVSGILSVIAGALAIMVPAVASVTFTIFIGWLLVFAGAAMLVSAFTNSDDRVWRVIDGLLALGVGVFILVAPLTGTLTLTFMLAAWCLAAGAVMLYEAFRRRGRPEALLIGVNGVVSIILGLLIALDLPSSAEWALGLLVGVNLIFWGVRALFAAGALKRLVG